MSHLLAEISQEDWLQSLLRGGSAAAVLGPTVAWFAFRLEKILEKLREAVERNSNALMVSVLNTHNLDEGLKTLAEKIRDDSGAALNR